MAKFQSESEWKQAKKAFETATGKKRPKKSFLVFWKKGSGIEGALKECDKIANQRAAPAKDLRTATNKLKKVVTEYMKDLDDAIDKEGQSDTGEDIKSDLYRHLKVLKTTAEKFVDLFEFETQNLEELEKNPRDIAGLASKTAHANVKKSLSNAIAAIQSVKSDPTAANYNAHFDMSNGEVGRKLATSLKAFLGTGATWDVQGHITALDAFSTGNKMSVKLSTSSEDVLSQLKEFSGLVKAVVKDFEGG